MIWTSEEPVTLGGFTLSLAAIAFFVGLSVEGVFGLIQTLIDGVVSTTDRSRPRPLIRSRRHKFDE